MASRNQDLDAITRLLKAWQDNDWLRQTPSRPPDAPVCLLRRSCTDTELELSRSERTLLDGLIAGGFTLQSGWSRPWESMAWIGQRLFFGRAASFPSQRRFAAIACSHLGRDDQYLPCWPELLEAALRDIYARNDQLLVVRRTTMYDAAIEYSKHTNIGVTEIRFDRKPAPLTDWLGGCLNWAHSGPGEYPEPVWASRDIEAESQVEEDKILQDKLLFALADRIYALTIREKGRLESLVSRRLAQPDFPSGSIYTRMPPKKAGKQSQVANTLVERNLAWLDQGAVGWYLPEPQQAPVATRCQMAKAAEGIRTRCTIQPCARLSAISKLAPGDDWNWLAHCTRGAAGPIPGESKSSYFARLRITGQTDASHPLQTLHLICQEQRLRGNHKWTRTNSRVVSFSAVHLTELLSRRRFSSHLGRWDWEPYGVLVHRDVLAELGAREVIYGDEPMFQELANSDRPFFQPKGRQQKWIAEREWRFLGDLNLADLPSGSVALFAKRRQEALDLARTYAWPVFWTSELTD